MVKETSLQAYQELKDSKKLMPDCMVVFDAMLNLYQKLGQWPTDKEIKRECNRIDGRKTWEINQINGRRNNLIRDGIVQEADKRKCSIGNRMACTWEIIYPSAQLQEAS